jgi:hypothetical protein
MPVNLSNLNISLDNFNKAAKGAFNIGQLKLNADGTGVVRTNSRKTLTFLNKTQIRPEETLAIKNAFCEAFRREGLSDDAIADIRQKLGLRDTMRETLKAGEIKPLSAAEVREIIDEYAGAINGLRGADKPHLETSADLYRGVDQETLKDRKTIRDERNARSESLQQTTVGGTVNQMLDLLEGPAGDTPLPIAAKAIALEICNVLGRPGPLSAPGSKLALQVANVTLKHDASRTIVAQFRLDDGAAFSVDTNLTRDELLAQMRNVLHPKPPKAPEEPPKVQEEAPKVQEGQPKAPEGQPKVQEAPPKAPEEIQEEREEPQAAPLRKPRNPFHAPVIEDLRRVFSIVKDPVSMTAEKLRAAKKLDKVIKGVELSEETLEVHARGKAREKLTDQVVGPLVVALREARGLDVRNTELVNQVRNVIAGDERIDAEALVDRIIDALDTEQVDFTANVGKDIEDDFDKPLNINELLGNNG